MFPWMGPYKQNTAIPVVLGEGGRGKGGIIKRLVWSPRFSTLKDGTTASIIGNQLRGSFGMVVRGLCGFGPWFKACCERSACCAWCSLYWERWQGTTTVPVV